MQFEREIIMEDLERTNLARVADQPPVASGLSAEAGALVMLIERAVSNPSVDIDKMERLLQMQERVLDRNAKTAYFAALSQMQPELPVIAERGGIKDRGGNVQSTYAKWEDINQAIGPVLSKHGFALSFRTGAEDAQITVTGILSHREGHSEQTTLRLPVDGSGSKNAVQAVGSSTSYGKRYTAQALLNLTSRGEDDDGKAGGGGFITQDQADEIQALMEDVGADRARFLKFAGVGAIADIPAGKFKEAINALEAKRKAK